MLRLEMVKYLTVQPECATISPQNMRKPLKLGNKNWNWSIGSEPRSLREDLEFIINEISQLHLELFMFVTELLQWFLQSLHCIMHTLPINSEVIYDHSIYYAL